MNTILIGIAGGSASGKSSIAKKLKDHFDTTQHVVILRMDDYYRDQSDISMEVRLKTNYDHPFAFDMDLLVHDLKELKAGHSIEKPVYDFINHTRSDYREKVASGGVIIVEGLMVLENQDVRDLLDIKIFVDAPADTRFIRRLVRDVKKRGRSLDHVIDQYMTTVRVMHDQFIEPSKRYADVIIPEGAHNKVAIDLLTTKISSIIQSNNVL